jgi:hypothetical protein
MPLQLAALGLGGAMALAMPAVLECRLAAGPWQQCRMVVAPNGLAWTLELAGEAIHFRHDGRGTVHMGRRQQPWRTVKARWLADASLCWDGVCARGAIPLD